MLTIDYNLLKIGDGERILDIGCGAGRHSLEACKIADCLVYALDIDSGDLSGVRQMFQALDEQGEARGNWLLIEGTILNLPFRDASIDKIICSEVLEHITDDQQAVSEITRVLKDDGVVAISVPTYLPEAICWKLSRDYHHQPGGHIRIYRTGELISTLRRNNLRIYATRRKHALHTFYWIARCIFGVNREKALIPSLYHRFLVWDLKSRNRLVRLLEDFLNHIFPKSVAFYAGKVRDEDDEH